MQSEILPIPPARIALAEKHSVVISEIHIVRKYDLFDVAHATRRTRPFAGLIQCGQQHRRQNCNNSYYNEQLNKGEMAPLPGGRGGEAHQRDK